MPSNQKTVQFPKFPSLWTEADVERKDFLKTVRKKQEEAYMQHYTPEAWSRKSWFDRKARQYLASTWMTLNPKEEWSIGHQELATTGLTPAHADRIGRVTEREYRELERRQEISEAMPHILKGILLNVQAGRLTSSVALLRAMFPELDPDSGKYLNLTEEERGYFENFLGAAVGKTPEEMETLYQDAVDPSLPGLTGLEDITLRVPGISPTQLLSSVALSKNAEEIQQALQAAYPPQEAQTFDEQLQSELEQALEEYGLKSMADQREDTERLEAASEEDMERLETATSKDLERLDELKQQERFKCLESAPKEELKQLEATAKEDQAEDLERLEEAKKKEEKEEGKPTTIEDSETGDSFYVNITDDGCVWFEDELVGKVDETTGLLIPFPEYIDVTFEPRWWEHLPGEYSFFFPVADEHGVEQEILLTFDPDEMTITSKGELLARILSDGTIEEVNPPLWKSIAGGFLTAIDIALTPFEWVGSGMQSFFTDPPKHPKVAEFDEWMSEASYKWLDRIEAGESTPEEMQEWALAQNELRDKLIKDLGFIDEQHMVEVGATNLWEETPWWQKVLWELPAWVALGKAGISFTSLRRLLVAGAAKGGLKGVAANVGAKVSLINPAYWIETGLGVTIRGVIRLVPPLQRKVAQAAVEKAMDKATKQWMKEQGLTATPETLKVFKDLLFNLPAPKTWAEARKQATLILSKKYGNEAAFRFSVSGRLDEKTIQAVIAHAKKVGDKELEKNATAFLSKFKAAKLAHKEFDLMREDFFQQFTTDIEAAMGGSLTDVQIKEIFGMATAEAEKYFPSLYRVALALEGAPAGSHTIVMEAMPSLLQIPLEDLTPEVIARIIEHGIRGVLPVTTGLVTQLRDMGFSQTKIEDMTVEEAWCNLFKGTLPDISVVTSMQAPSRATHEPVVSQEVVDNVLEEVGYTTEEITSMTPPERITAAEAFVITGIPLPKPTPLTPEAQEVNKLNIELNTVRVDLDVFKQSYKIQLERAAKMELHGRIPGEAGEVNEALTNLKREITGLEAREGVITKRVAELELAPKYVSPVGAEVARKGALYDKNVAIIKAVKPGEQVRQAVITKEVTADIQRIVEKLPTGTILEDSTGQRWILRKSYNKDGSLNNIILEDEAGKGVVQGVYSNGKWGKSGIYTIADSIEVTGAEAEIVSGAEERWDKLSTPKKLAWADSVGIARTAANKPWGELTSVQQSLLSEASIPKTGIPRVINMKGIDTPDQIAAGEHINTAAKEQTVKIATEQGMFVTEYELVPSLIEDVQEIWSSSAQSWNSQSIAQRLKVLEQAGFTGLKGKLDWDSLTFEQQRAVFTDTEVAISKEGVKRPPLTFRKGGVKEVQDALGISSQEAAKQLHELFQWIPGVSKNASARDINPLHEAFTFSWLNEGDPTAFFRALRGSLPLNDDGTIDWGGNIPPHIRAAKVGDKPGQLSDVASWKLYLQSPEDAAAAINSGWDLDWIRMRVVEVFGVCDRARISWTNRMARDYQDMRARTGYGQSRPKWLSFPARKRWDEAAFSLADTILTEDVGVANVELLKKKKIAIILKGFSRGQQDALLDYAKGLRDTFDKLLGWENMCRKLYGLPGITPIQAYMKHMRRVSIWRNTPAGMMRAYNKAKREGILPDWLKSKPPFISHAQARKQKVPKELLEKNPDKLFSEYLDEVGRDIFDTAAILNAKAYIKLLKKKGLDNAADWLESWNMRRAGFPPRLTRALDRTPVRIIKRPSAWLKSRLNDSVFALNPGWNIFTQSSSTIMNISMIGLKHSILGFSALFPGNKEAEKYYKACYSYLLKEYKSGSVSAQDIGAKLFRSMGELRTPPQTAHDATLWFTRYMELVTQKVTIYGAILHGKSRGLAGGELIAYASGIGAKGQSAYDPLWQPEAMTSVYYSCTIGMFQTFVHTAMTRALEQGRLFYWDSGFGAYKGLKVGSAGYKTALSTRIIRLIQILAAVILWNEMSYHATGRRPWQPSSIIPSYEIVKSFVPGQVSSRSLPLTGQFARQMDEAVRDALEYDRYDLIAEVLARYTATAGLGIVKFKQAIEAITNEGRVVDVKGDLMFEMEPEDWLKALTFGIYSTEAGREYRERIFQGLDPTTQQLLKKLEEWEDRLGKEWQGDIIKLGKYRIEFNRIMEDEPLWKVDQSVGYSDLDVFLVEYEQFREWWYAEIPAKDREAYRKKNPEVDAMMVFWGDVRSYLSIEAKRIAEEELFVDYGVWDNPLMHWSTKLEAIPVE